jgi:hypothetical protein
MSGPFIVRLNAINDGLSSVHICADGVVFTNSYNLVATIESFVARSHNQYAEAKIKLGPVYTPWNRCPCVTAIPSKTQSTKSWLNDMESRAILTAQTEIRSKM